MVWPSGDRSSEIQVPSFVVKSSVRVGISGRELLRSAARAELSFGLGRDGLRDEGGRQQSAHAPRAAMRRAHGSGRARGGHATGPGIDPKRNHARHRSPPWTPPQRLVQIRMVPQKVPPPWYSGGRPLTVA